MNLHTERFQALAVGALVVVGPSVAAQSIKLNRPLLRTSVADSYEATVSPDGNWLVYKITGFGPSYSELHSVPLDGSAPPASISPPSTALTSIYGPFLITSDNRRVVYTVVTGSQRTFASSLLDGSAPATTLFQVGPQGYQLAPDGSRVVVVAEATPGVSEIFSVPVDGSSGATTLNPPMVPGGDVFQYGRAFFAISPDSRWVVYLADQEQDGVPELFAVPIDGSAPAHKLSGALPAPGAVGFGPPLQFGAPDLVLFTSSTHELYSVPIDGSRPAQLIHSSVWSLSVSPDQAWGVFTAYSTPGTIELFRAPVGGGPVVRLNGPLVAGGNVLENDYSFDASGTRVVYLADQDVDGVTELYSVPLDASQPPTKLNQPLSVAGRVGLFRTSPVSPQVVYWSYDGTETSIRTVPIDRSSEPITLRNAWYHTSVNDFRVTPDGQRVVLSNFARPYEIYSVPIDGSSHQTRLTQAFIDDRQLYDAAFTITSQNTVVYIADADHPGAFEVYSVPADGSAAPVRRSVSLPLQTRGYVSSFRISPDGKRVAFEANGDRLEADLYVAHTDQRASSRRLVVGPHGLYDFHPDSRRLFYASEIPGDRYLYSVVDDHTPPVRIGVLTYGNQGQPFRFTQDGQRAVFPSVSELHSAPSDGSGPTLVLATGLNNDEGLELALDTAFYRTGSGPQLMTRPVDGSLPATNFGSAQSNRSGGFLRISTDGSRFVFATPTGMKSAFTHGGVVATLQTRGLTGPVQFSPNSAQLFYLDDFSVSQRQELFVQPFDGSVAPSVLAAMPANGDVTAMTLAPNGSAVFFIADRDQDDVFELYRVSVDGGPPTRLSANLVAGGDVDRFLLTPTRVVYLADQDTNDQFELFSVPRDGSTPPIRLNPPLVAGSDVTDFWVESTGTFAVYRADAEEDEEFDLYAARIDGAGTAHRLHPRPVAGGDVVYVQLVPEHSIVVFRGDLDQNGFDELYASNLNPKILRGR